MKRTFAYPQKKLRQPQRQARQQQQTTAAAKPTTTPNEPPDGSNNHPNASSKKINNTPNSKKAVVASLVVDRSRPVHPYSSLALSPKGRYALVAGKDTMQLVTVGPDGLRPLRSLKITHHFYNTTGTSPATTPQQRGNIRDAFKLAAESRASAVTASVANMNLNQQHGNIIVTKVAWSNNFYSSSSPTKTNRKTSQRANSVGGAGSIAELGMDESSCSIGSLNADAFEQVKPSKGRRVKSQGEGDNYRSEQSTVDETMKEDDSFVAVAGSNGVVVVWSAKRLLFSDSVKPPPTKKSGGFIKTASSSSSAAFLLKKQQRTQQPQQTQQPEGILNQHTRAINSMAWHPTRSGLLLTASQDGTIKLWERKAIVRALNETSDESSDNRKQHDRRSWFSMVGAVVGGGSSAGGPGGSSNDDDEDIRKYTWRCRVTFILGDQDAVRDLCWNKHIPDVFGVVTSNGNLVVYNMHVPIKALVKIVAHTGDAASLDWHPRWPYVVATGGSSDRFVKIWDFESSLESILNATTSSSHHNRKAQQYQNDYSQTHDTAKSDTSSNYSVSSSESVHSPFGVPNIPSIATSNRDSFIRNTSFGRHNKSGFSKHVVSISASVTQVRWRPPSNDFVPSSTATNNGSFHDSRNDFNKEEPMIDRHDTMLAVVTARQTSAGGSGTLSLWSFHRPFMSLSMVEGHEEGAISEFVWIKTPQVITKASYDSFEFKREKQQQQQQPQRMNSMRLLPESPLLSLTNAGKYNRDDEPSGEATHVSYIWQNVLSVGRDGKCIMQSFARGERRIRSVPSSCFAMANLSPFQQGYGSLQCFSVYQDVPNRVEDDFMLTGLRQDEHTAKAPGVFFEEDLGSTLEAGETKKKEKRALGKRFPSSVPELVFSVVDQGQLDANGVPIASDEDALCIAPEVLHMSRFARLYKLYPDDKCPTRVELCLYNSKVAKDLNCGPLARMWNTVSSLLRASGLKELTSIDPSKPTSAFQFVIFRTVKSLLLERAEAGDVQTNVAMCEVLQVVDSSGEQTRIPGLGIKLVREWYLSYIDLLHRMCLFTAAAFLIKYCKDPAIGALSQQSTTIHESCPRCGKPLESLADSSYTGDIGGTTSGINNNNNTRKVCKNCRRRVAMCFICHEPVTGMFVWCPGCGHGGHLEHALQWFGGLNGRKARTVCPTGCGHKCNLVQMASSFPRTTSTSVSDSSSMDNILNINGHQPRCMPASPLLGKLIINK